MGLATDAAETAASELALAEADVAALAAGSLARPVATATVSPLSAHAMAEALAVFVLTEWSVFCEKGPPVEDEARCRVAAAAEGLEILVDS